MEIAKKQLRNGFSLPVFGLGTWRMGGDAADIAAIRTAIDLGITHIDTAELYAAGHAEEMVAEAIKGYDRSKLTLVSKVLATHLSKNDLRTSLEASLRRLQTDYLDLYLIHFPSDTIPITETMEIMNQLVDEEKIKNIGISNFRLDRMKMAQKVSKRNIVATQVHYNLTYREPEHSGLLEYCQNNDILLIAWRPVEKGLLTKSGIPIVDKLCQKYQKTPAQIAINWLISQKNVVTLSKMSSPAHIRENLGALDWKMESDDIERLRKEFPDTKRQSNAVPLK